MAGPNRRNILLGLGVGAVSAVSARAETRNVDDAPAGHAETAAKSVPFYGRHQAGIVTPRPAAGIVAAFDVVATSLDDLERMLKALTLRAAFLTQGGKVPTRDPKLPPADSGLLGPVIAPDNLTITLGFGASFFDRDGLSGLMPARLERMAQFPNDALEAEMCHGDISIQFCANLQDTNIHALRDVVKNLSEFLVLRWVIEGTVPPVPPAPDGSTPSARNFLGFRDGSANPDSNDTAAMDRIVWAGADEPDWAADGSYQVVRIIRNFVERWDRTALSEQERIMGRIKHSGAPMDRPDAGERDLPDFAADPAGDKTAMDAHIRLANPRDAASQQNLILRRPFNYSRGAVRNGQLDQGLLFICYQRDLQAGFITVQNRLNGEPLEEYIKPVGGGYFFVPPGVSGPQDYLGARLIAEARRA
ncbi:iron uptake transporter deferrochelatase/peroxidase subunit [Paracoccus laeviglucosivorans]|uniref:Deferrochelatase n=1 Tax=Paracoccus laeviglucosivorans TaxID=1197861 RepID=A0A521F7G3_9RHOB|nr:iron uptake transporter deferrochelatase/peroxidase subunit [Paracoccus laeviglucosivorans]SMO92122.1 deferrochelatase/peroxidase EfeB [Paracoccus laeviglucosivorans]